MQRWRPRPRMRRQQGAVQGDSAQPHCPLWFFYLLSFSSQLPDACSIAIRTSMKFAFDLLPRLNDVRAQLFCAASTLSRVLHAQSMMSRHVYHTSMPSM